MSHLNYKSFMIVLTSHTSFQKHRSKGQNKGNLYIFQHKQDKIESSDRTSWKTHYKKQF